MVANSRDLLQRAGTWVQRLDRLDASASNLRVYQARHVNAERLAEMVNDIFADGVAASGGSEDPSSQFPPEASPTIQEASARATAMGRNLDQRMGEGTGERAAGGATTNGFGQSETSGSSSVGWDDVRITANADNNTLLIYARADQQTLIERAISALDKPSAQVAIEANDRGSRADQRSALRRSVLPSGRQPWLHRFGAPRSAASSSIGCCPAST